IFPPPIAPSPPWPLMQPDRETSLSATGGGEGRGEVGERISSELRRYPPHPPHRLRDGSPPSPPAGGRRGQIFCGRAAAAWVKTPAGGLAGLIGGDLRSRRV